MKIIHLVLQTAHLAALREFYADVLGLPALARRPASLTVRAGATRLTFEQGPAGFRGFYHFAFNVAPDRFQRARAWIAAVTPLLEDAEGRDTFTFRAWNSDACYFCDPAGNICELIARHDLPTGVGDLLLGVSEIGVVVDNPPRFVERLAAEAKIPVYRESVADTFAAAGSDEGLFILVPPGRQWYPDTGRAAVAAPLQVDFEGHDGVARRLAGPPYVITAT